MKVVFLQSLQTHFFRDLNALFKIQSTYQQWDSNPYSMWEADLKSAASTIPPCWPIFFSSDHTMWYSLNILPPYTVFHTIKKARSPWPQWGHRVRNSLLMRTEREKRNLLYRPIHIFNKNTHFTMARGGTPREACIGHRRWRTRRKTNSI